MSLQAINFVRDHSVGLAIGKYQGVEILEVGVAKAALLRDARVSKLMCDMHHAAQTASYTRGATNHVKKKIVCSCSFDSAAAANDAAATNPERFTQSRIPAKHTAKYQARLVTKRGEHRTIVDAALACSHTVCELSDGHRFLDKTAKALCASVGKADGVCSEIDSSNLKKNDFETCEK
jgi:hypothetical protein